MIDSVLKGTGNSRFLKSAVPAGTSWADALAMLQAGTFPIDFNGINAEGFQQVGTPLNKANLLKDATAAQIGLPPSTTPDGMFQALAKTGDLHVWRKTVVTKEPVPEVPGSYTLGTAQRLYVATRTFANDSYESYVEGVLASNSITIDLDGKVTLTDPAEVTLYIYNRRDGVTSQTGREAISGYSYFLIPSTSASFIGCEISMTKDAIYYIPSTSSYHRTSSSSGGQSSFDAAQLVTGVPGTPSIPAGTTTTYPVSTNLNAYQEGDDAKEAGYTLGDAQTVTIVGGGSPQLLTGSSLGVTDDGTLSITSPITAGVYNSSKPDTVKSSIAGKYVYIPVHSSAGGLKGSTGFFKVDSSVSVAKSPGSDGSNVFTFTAQPVTGYAAIPAGTTIEYLGKLGDKARVQVLSYVGTGTYGENNPNSLTFDFAPKVVMFLRYYKSGITQSGALGSYGSDSRVITPESLTTTYARYNGFGDKSYSYAKKSKDGKTIFWYNDSSYHQGNDSGYIYYFLVIG